MNTYIFDKKNYSTYKEFYDDFYIKLNIKDHMELKEFISLNYSATLLWDFLNSKWLNIHIILKNFDLEKIKNQKNYEDYEWNIILGVLNRFIEKYPNNKLEFINN